MTTDDMELESIQYFFNDNDKTLENIYTNGHLKSRSFTQNEWVVDSGERKTLKNPITFKSFINFFDSSSKFFTS
jgi:predicted extracellular nuclease